MNIDQKAPIATPVVDISGGIYLFHQGKNFKAYELLGCHKLPDGQGYVFRTWAPNALAVSVTGDFTDWKNDLFPMYRISESIWEVVIDAAGEGQLYKFAVTGPDRQTRLKADPYGTRMELPPGTASIVCTEDDFRWTDGVYLNNRARRKMLRRPMNIYEMHLGSWKRKPDGSYQTYREIAVELAAYVKSMNYTHVEIMPVTEYPFDGSWGYQVTGYFAPTARYGTPEDFRFFINTMHKAGIGVIMDWVCAHFPRDANGLYQFDGTNCYEYQDALKCDHPDWGTRIFDFGRNEVKAFLISNALYWVEEFHLDGIRVDAVASMLYLNYGKQDGQWRPNVFGGQENLEAKDFLQELNTVLLTRNPSALMIAEESTAWPNVTKPASMDGLGFNYKWNMGWMNDVLSYMSLDPFFRKDNHNKLTFSFYYAFSENYVLPLSHDEVVHGKCSLIGKMPGEYEQKFANLRAFYGYYMAHPGKKLLFMGGEFGQFIEWNYKQGLDWQLLDYDAHRNMQDYVRDLNGFYLKHEQLWENEGGWEGFQWIVPDDNQQNILAFMRKNLAGKEMICVSNFSTVSREKYRFGVPYAGKYTEAFTSNLGAYGGDGTVNAPMHSDEIPSHGFDHSIELTIPAMTTLFITFRKTPKTAIKKAVPAKVEEAAAKAE